MQHSADFSTFHGHLADVARAERDLELRRLAAERRALDPEPRVAASVTRRRRGRTAWLALR
jgi:hypothetical protein